MTLTYEVIVSPATGGGTPTGASRFYVDGAAFGPAVALVVGRATGPDIAGPVAGLHAITATYAGYGGFPPGTNLATAAIAPAPLTVAAGVASKVHNRPDLAYTATYAGFLPGDGPGSLGGSLS